MIRRLASLLIAIFAIVVLVGCKPETAQSRIEVKTRFWFTTDVFAPGPPGSFDETAVKDPSLVFFEGAWHLFYTARGQGAYSLGYASGANWSDLASASRYQLSQLLGSDSPYAAAPQVFFFEPLDQWVLIFQNRDAYYQPVYATTTSLSEPESWSLPKKLVEKDDEAKWIDFWIICDDTTAYFFYTRDHRDVFVRTTELDRFPTGWGEPKMAFYGVHEAVHVYRSTSSGAYQLFFEKNEADVRSFGLATSLHPLGPWRLADSTYATGDQLRFADGVLPWTYLVSHGEPIRAGFDQHLLFDARSSAWIIQGLRRDLHDGEYAELPWSLGLMTADSTMTASIR